MSFDAQEWLKQEFPDWTDVRPFGDEGSGEMSERWWWCEECQEWHVVIEECEP